MKRRELLGSVGAGAVSMLAAGVASADRSRFYAEADGAIEHDPVFEKREWGYVRRDWDRPTGTDRPVVYTHDGYAGASFAADGPTHYVRTSDGTLIATSVGVHSSEPSLDLGGDYVHVQSSVRATACSGGSEPTSARSTPNGVTAGTATRSSSGSPIVPGRSTGSASGESRTPG